MGDGVHTSYDQNHQITHKFEIVLVNKQVILHSANHCFRKFQSIKALFAFIISSLLLEIAKRESKTHEQNGFKLQTHKTISWILTERKNWAPVPPLLSCYVFNLKILT
ncbi:hypothetical protein L1887_03206 [Cichorium endivia]|nr:hypothetical protein L1887_03206 [Cichorium endivia]